MTDQESLVPAFDQAGDAFERVGQQNGSRFWYARTLAAMLGYETFTAFQNAINRAIGTCTTLGISVAENFGQTTRVVDGTKVEDYKLSRFGCYLAAMNGDVRRPAVAVAQAYFAGLAVAMREYVEAAQSVDRV